MVSQAAEVVNTPVLYFQQINVRAQKGDTQAQVCLGDLYAHGSGTAQDYVQARVWYQTAAKNGDPRGKLRLGQMYQYGNGFDQDPAKALSIYRELVAQGFMPAANGIGELYLTGAGVPADYAQALDWFNKAAAADNYWAAAHLALMYQLGIGVKRDSDAARVWSLKAAAHDIPCLPDFGELVPLLIHGYLQMPPGVDASSAGYLTITYTYQDRRAVKASLGHSSGNVAVDRAWLEATQAAVLPPWPAAFAGADKTQAFLIPGSDTGTDAAFTQAIHDAVRQAVIFPMNVLLHGSSGTGFAIVGFDYVDGRVSNPRIETSSSDADEDREALTAVEHAVYPPTPAEYAHQQMHLSVRVDFGTITPAAAPATAKAPVVATSKGSSAATSKAPAIGTTKAPAPITHWD